MRKVFKYLGRTILAIILLLVLVVFLIYLPPVQNFLKNKAIAYVSRHYGLVVKAEHFRLGFPLDLTLEQVYAGRTETDTLLAVGALHLKAGLGGILKKEVSIDDLSLQKVKFVLSNDSSGMSLKVVLQEVNLLARQVDLGKQRVKAEYIRLTNGEVFLKAGENSPPDTTASAPLKWVIEVNEIDLAQVGYQMQTQAMPWLGAGINKGQVSRGQVDLGRQCVEVDSVKISGAWCNMQTAATDTLQEGRQEPADTLPALPWTVRAQALQLENSAFSMQAAGEKKTELVLSGIRIAVDSVYNRGTTIRAQLKDLTAVQQGGLAVTSMQAGITLDSAETVLQGVYIRTPYSWIRAQAQSDTQIQNLMKNIPLSLTLNGQIGLLDVVPFYPDIPDEIRNKKVNVNTVLTATAKRIQVGQLVLSMPGNFKVTGSGSLSSYQDLRKMKGSFILRGEMPDVSFARKYLGQTGVQIPHNLDMLVRMKADRGTLGAFLRLCCGQGCMTLDASYKLEQQSYDADLAFNRFPLDRFLPADSLGNISAGIRLAGEGFTWPDIRAGLKAQVQSLEFRQYEYQHIELDVALNRTDLKGTVISRDVNVPLNLIFQGDSIQNEYVATLTGKVGEVNLDKLHFVTDSLIVGGNLDIRATAGKPGNYTLIARLDSLEMTDASKKYVLGKLTLDMFSDLEKTTLSMATGDLNLNFRTDTSLNVFIENAGKVGLLLNEQIKTRDVNMEVVRKDMPSFSLQVKGGKDNAIAGFLKYRNIGFRHLMLDVVSRKRTGIRLGFVANAPYFGTVRLDSVQLGAWQTGKSLVYSFAAGSSSEAWKGIFNISMTGRMQEDLFRAELKQKDASGRIGFDMGINLQFEDTTLTASLFPINPILGYSRWMVNPDNRIVVGPKGRIRANLRMVYMNKLISIQSLPDSGEMHDRLQVEIEGLDLASLSQTVPFMPELSGKLNTDLLLYSRDKIMGADGNIQVIELGYGQQRIGTVDLGLQYVAGNSFTEHAVEFELRIDSIRRAVAKGSFATADTNRKVVVDVNIPSFPLYIANVFIPADLMKLGGELKGDMYLRGTLDKPELNGRLGFVDATADVVMLGTSFRLDTTALPVRDGKILFKKYRFTAPNNSNMIIDGNITLTPFDEMNMNLAVEADNFEVVNVKKNDVSLIYGKAYVDVHSLISGAFSALNVTGNVNLLNRTAITYTLRSSGPQLVDKSVDLVRFVSFRDTTLNEADDLTNRIKASSFALRMLIEIGDQVRVGVDLSEDGSNHVDIQGGGNLVLSMNPENGMVLSGKYILSGGTVVYNVPIVGKKEFSIQTGSFVEWTGNVANPILNISASESVKANVDDGEQVRQVNFEAIIRIQNTLSRPDITFDLSAPNDMVIQNQLATFSQEERTRQALNLLIYNTYTAPGAAKSGNNSNMANNAIYSFVENELNKYTQKAGLTVGFDSRNTDENTTRTDVTYQFSRQLFNDRIRVKIGGRISTDANENQSNNLQDNLVDDISIEYVLTKKRNLYIKVFRHSNYESVLDGEVTQTGAGIVWRKNFRKFRDLFKNKNREERKAQKMKQQSLNSEGE